MKGDWDGKEKRWARGAGLIKGTSFLTQIYWIKVSSCKFLHVEADTLSLCSKQLG